MRSRVWRIAQWVLGLLVVAFVTRSVVLNWEEIRGADLAWRISLPLLAAGVAATWLTFALLAEAWRRMVRGWGYPLPVVDAARVWLLSSMAKYVPGKVWALAGMAVMARRRGVPAWAATGSALILQVLSVGTGALVVAVGGLAVVANLGLGPRALLLLALGTGALTATLLAPPVTRRLLRFGPEGGSPAVPPRFGTVLFGAGANLIAWVGYGLSFWLFARGTLPEAPLGPGESIAAFAASYLAGAIAPFAPGGLGVREGVLVLVLRDRTGLANALALAAVSRLGTTLAEVAACVPFLLRREPPSD